VEKYRNPWATEGESIYIQYGQVLCFNNNVSNLYNNSVVAKTNGMAFNRTTTLKLIY